MVFPRTILWGFTPTSKTEISSFSSFDAEKALTRIIIDVDVNTSRNASTDLGLDHGRCKVTFLEIGLFERPGM